MSLVFSSALMLVLILITYQDFKFRAVTWFFFPLLAAILIGESMYHEIWSITVEYFIINASFMIIQLLTVTLYLSFRHRSFIRIWHQYLGLGDILFLFILCFFFSPINLIIFYLSSLIIAILVTLVLRRSYSSFSLIPLAGIQSALLTLLIMLNIFINAIDYRTDLMIVEFL
jgi:hypothetical protein